MLNKINYILLSCIMGFAIYAIYLNVNIYKMSNAIFANQEKLTLNTIVVKQLKLELLNKTSNVFLDTFAKDSLNMHVPKKIHTLD